MKVKKNILKYKHPDTGEYTPIPIVVSGTNENEKEVAVQSTQPTDQALWVNPNGSGNEIIIAEIDDNAISNEKTWSSTKINEKIGEGGSGSNVELTAESISDALGYTPANTSDLAGKLDIKANLNHIGNLLYVNRSGNIVADNETTFFKYRGGIDIILDSQANTGNIFVLVPDKSSEAIETIAIKSVASQISTPDNHGISYYYIDLYSANVQYVIEDINHMFNVLHESTFPRITFEDTYRKVKGSTSNYFIDIYGGLNFIFGMYHVRITTNANGGSAEPTSF